MTGAAIPRKRLVLLGCSLVTLALGSVHAFSVLLVSLEQAFAESRALTSLTYSLALVCLTFAVLVGHRLYGKLSPPVFVLFACVAAACGCAFAAAGSSLWGVWAGYGLIFGAANGLGYGFALQLAAQANPHRRALGMGVVTAAYAGGAALAPFVLAYGLERGGHSLALYYLAGCIALIGIIASGVLSISRAQITVSGDGTGNDLKPDTRRTIHLWLAYGAGVASGLMVIGHASGILKAAGAGGELTVLAPVLVALGNMCGGIVAGWTADRIGIRAVLTALPLVSVAGLAVLMVLPGAGAALIGLTVAGFAYGAIIAVYPAAVSYLFGQVAGIKAYGRVFTAWGTFGLLLPWLAGYLFDQTGTYDMIILIAAIISLLSCAAASRLPDAKLTPA